MAKSTLFKKDSPKHHKRRKKSKWTKCIKHGFHVCVKILEFTYMLVKLIERMRDVFK